MLGKRSTRSASMPERTGARRSKRARLLVECGSRWVRRKIGTFSFRSTAPCGSSFMARRVTFDGGSLLVEKLDERLGFGALIGPHLADAREEHPVAADRPFAAAGIHSAGGLRRC